MIKFKDFMSAYVSELWDYDDDEKETIQPIEVWFEENKFLLAVDWFDGNDEALKKIVSKKVFESEISGIYLNQETGRIGIKLLRKFD